MPKLKLLFYTLLLTGSLYLAFKHTDITKILAQVSPEFSAQVSQKYNELLAFNQNIFNQSEDSTKFLSYLTILNEQKQLDAQESYESIVIDENTDLQSLPEAQAIKTLRLSIFRYEILNDKLYDLLGEIKSSGQAISDSGFATNNIEEEIENLNNNITKIEAHISTIDYIADQIENKSVMLNDGINKASELIGTLNIEYILLFNKTKELINNAQ